MQGVPCFVGAPLDLASTNRVAEYSKSLRRASASAGTTALWVPPPNLQVTLRSLGSLDPGLLGPLGDLVSEISAKFTVVRVQLGTLLQLPDAVRPQRFALGVTRGSESLVALRLALDESLAALGIPPPEHPFRPRVTLATVHASAISAPLRAPPPPGVNAQVTELCLWRTDLTRPGEEHHCLRRVRLAAPPPLAAPKGQSMSKTRF